MKVANYIEVSTCDDRRLYFNDHHNLDDNVTSKEPDASGDCFGWKIVNTNVGYIYTILPFILMFIWFIFLTFLTNKISFFFYFPSSLEGKQTTYSHLSREGGGGGGGAQTI